MPKIIKVIFFPSAVLMILLLDILMSYKKTHLNPPFDTMSYKDRLKFAWDLYWDKTVW